MASTGLSSDTQTYHANIGASTEPGQYQLLKCAHENNSKCRIPYGCNATGSKRSSRAHPLMSTPQVDLESNLMGIDKILTRTELPSCKWKEYEESMPKTCECNMNLVSEDTLLSTPKCQFRGMTVDRFYQPSCPASNPISWRIGGNGIDTVQIAKDFYSENIPNNRNQTNKVGNEGVEYAYKNCC